jgi:DDE family transposase
MSRVTVPPILATLIGRLAAAVPGRARATFTELLIGAAVTKGGHVTDAILAVGLSRAWTTSYWLLERGRWSWLAVWQALLGVLKELFTPPVWHVVIDDTVVERISARAPGSLIHHNHTAKPNRSRFLRGQGWLCLAAVVERGWKVGAVPLMLHLVRRGTHRGKLKSACFLLRRLGQRLGRVRLLLDAWFMRARLIEAAVADGHTVIGRARRDLALYAVPRLPRCRRRGRPRKYGPRMTRERIEALPVHRSAQILYGKLEVVRYRSCRVAARFLKGRVVRAVWVELERPDRRDRPAEEWLLLCTDPDLPALEVVRSYAKRWAVEPLFAALKHGWGLKDAWQRSRQVLMRWVTILAAGYALAQMLAYTDPAHLPGLADPAPWRPPGTRTAGLIQAGIARLLRVVGPPALVAAIPPKFRPDNSRSTGRPPPEPHSPTDLILLHRPHRLAPIPGGNGRRL